MKQFASNKKVKFDYEIVKNYVAGMSLIGPEVKAIREGRISLKESFIKIVNNEAYLVQAHISRPTYLDSFTKFNETRQRKLLLTKAELRELQQAVTQKGLTVMALSCFQPDNAKNIKLSIAICKGKRDYDKRETLKRKQQELDSKRAMSERY